MNGFLVANYNLAAANCSVPRMPRCGASPVPATSPDGFCGAASQDFPQTLKQLHRLEADAARAGFASPLAIEVRVSGRTPFPVGALIHEFGERALAREKGAPAGKERFSMREAARGALSASA